MADVGQAVQFVLRQEDALLSGDITTLKGDSGGATRFGLASTSHPDLVEQGYFDEGKIDRDEALAMAELAYEDEYASKVMLDKISNQELANRFFSFTIHEGPHQATVLLQRSLNHCGCALDEDGRFGPKTLEAINTANSEKLLTVLRGTQEDFYRHLVAVRPDLMPYLHGFLNRAQA